MKSGENMLVKLIDERIKAHLGYSTLYYAYVIETGPLSVQPRALTSNGQKQSPVRYVRKLESVGDLKVGDEVLVGIIADSAGNYSPGQFYKPDTNRRNSIDSSIVIGVIK